MIGWLFAGSYPPPPGLYPFISSMKSPYHLLNLLIVFLCFISIKASGEFNDDIETGHDQKEPHTGYYSSDDYCDGDENMALFSHDMVEATFNSDSAAQSANLSTHSCRWKITLSFLVTALIGLSMSPEGRIVIFLFSLTHLLTMACLYLNS